MVQRNNIRDVELLERMILYLLDNVGHSFSARSISNYLKQENRKVSTETILNYIKACCDAYLFIKLRRKDIQGKKILSANEKYYSVDHGLRESILEMCIRDRYSRREKVPFSHHFKSGCSEAY